MERWSDDLKSASAVAYHVSVLATPSGPDAGDWVQNKAQGYLVGGAAIWLTSKATQGLKAAADRERPNGQGHDSFPSGHTAASAVHTRLASRNLRALDLSKGMHRSLDAGLDALRSVRRGHASSLAGISLPIPFSMALEISDRSSTMPSWVSKRTRQPPWHFRCRARAHRCAGACASEPATGRAGARVGAGHHPCAQRLQPRRVVLPGS
jgi:hypothetical protein